MKAYWSFLAARFKTRIQYRAAALAGMVTQFFWGFIRIMILQAFYASSVQVQPISFAQVVAYVWLGQAFLGLLPWGVERDIQEMIRNGNVSYELIRPLDTYAIWFIRTLAWRTAATLLRCIPLLLFAGLILPLLGANEWALMLPPSLPAALLFFGSMTLAIVLGCAITNLVHVSMLWTISGEGMSLIMPAFVTFFSGNIVPLPLFPQWAQQLFRFLPFHGLADTPYRIYGGNIPVGEASWVLLQQALWAIALVALGYHLMKRGLKRVVIQGG